MIYYIEISDFEILAYLCKIHDIVDDYCSTHVLIMCHIIGYVFMLNCMEVILLNMMFGLSYGVFMSFVRNE